jgi:outer membrane protein
VRTPRNVGRQAARGKRFAFLFVLLLSAKGPSTWAAGSLADPFNTSAAVLSSPAKNLLLDTPGAPGCNSANPSGEVDLVTAATYALCLSPKTREAWIDVQVKAAQLGVAAAAFGPTVSATLRFSADKSTSEVPSEAALSSAQTTSFRDYTLSLTWKLLDAGARDAQGRVAQQGLAAAQAAQDVALQAVLSATVKDYYSAVAAVSAVAAATSTEDDAIRSLQAAKARVSGGVASVIDQMQAQTDYAQAVYNRARAAGDARVARGVLAVDMGLNPNLPLTLPQLSSDVEADAGLAASIDQLLDEVKNFHPKTVEARAQLQAAIAHVDDVRAQGRPTLSLNAHATNSTQPVIPAVGLPPLPASGRDRFVGLQLDVPIFEGFARTYELRAAQATVHSQEANLRDIEQQVMLDVWTLRATLDADAENLRNTATLLDSATQTYTAAQQRYQKGVGSIIELLSAQSALSNARQRRLQALVDWRIVRLQLAASLGKLSLLALK